MCEGGGDREGRRGREKRERASERERALSVGLACRILRGLMMGNVLTLHIVVIGGHTM